MGEDFAPIDEVTGNVKTFEDAIEEAAAYLLRNTYPTYSNCLLYTSPSPTRPY